MTNPTADRNFFTAMAVCILAVTFIGFAPTFFLKEAFDTPDLTLKVHLHAALFTLWPLLLLTQAVLIRRGNYELHRKLGMAGAVLCVAMVITGIFVILDKPRFNIFGRAFIFTPLLALILFPIFIGLAIRFRRDAATHKRLILLGSSLLVPAGLRRVLNILGMTPADPNTAYWITHALILLPLLAFDLATRRRPHLATLIGGSILLLRHVLHEYVAYTDAWQHWAARMTAP
jgi:uncharacterized membrane protein YozB (DUF420 family)